MLAHLSFCLYHIFASTHAHHPSSWKASWSGLNGSNAAQRLLLCVCLMLPVCCVQTEVWVTAHLLTDMTLITLLTHPHISNYITLLCHCKVEMEATQKLQSNNGLFSNEWPFHLSSTFFSLYEFLFCRFVYKDYAAHTTEHVTLLC